MNREKKGQSASRAIRRGDIYYANLNPVVGSEQGGKRPVVVIQNDTGNRHSPTIIVAATTSKTDKPRLPTHILIGDHQSRLRQDTLILLEQIRTIDRSRLGNYIGHLSDNMINCVDAAIPISLGLTENII